jgi:hypothetical protein
VYSYYKQLKLTDFYGKRDSTPKNSLYMGLEEVAGHESTEHRQKMTRSSKTRQVFLTPSQKRERTAKGAEAGENRPRDDTDKNLGDTVKVK